MFSISPIGLFLCLSSCLFKSMCVLSALRPPENSDNYRTTAGSIMGVSMEQHIATNNDGNGNSLFKHKLKQMFGPSMALSLLHMFRTTSCVDFYWCHSTDMLSYSVR